LEMNPRRRYDGNGEIMIEPSRQFKQIADSVGAINWADSPGIILRVQRLVLLQIGTSH